MFTDDDRRTLYDALERSIGHDPAAILMGHLAPVGWVELATKGDIAELRGEMSAMKSELRGEIAELRGEMKAMLPKVITANIAASIATAGLVLAAVSLGG
jgi:hypothetical protein